MKELELQNVTCMGGWYIPPQICDDMINIFEKNNSIHIRGVSGELDNDEVDIRLDVKDSYDLSFSPKLKIIPFGEYLYHLGRCLHNYIEKYKYVDTINSFEMIEDYNIQKYLPGGGFKKWHFENSGMDKRVLVFMTYLNDVTDEGGTEFLYQNIKIQPQKGLTLIWPAGWTHTHRGIVSPTQTKYITTGWYSFK